MRPYVREGHRETQSISREESEVSGEGLRLTTSLLETQHAHKHDACGGGVEYRHDDSLRTMQTSLQSSQIV